jgi:hypothetical protein
MYNEVNINEKLLLKEIIMNENTEYAEEPTCNNCEYHGYIGAPDNCNNVLSEYFDQCVGCTFTCNECSTLS